MNDFELTQALIKSPHWRWVPGCTFAGTSDGPRMITRIFKPEDDLYVESFDRVGYTHARTGEYYRDDSHTVLDFDAPATFGCLYHLACAAHDVGRLLIDYTPHQQCWTASTGSVEAHSTTPARAIAHLILKTPAPKESTR